MRTIFIAMIATLGLGATAAFAQECTPEQADALASEATLALEALAQTDPNRAQELTIQMQERQAQMTAEGTTEGACDFYTAVIEAASS